MTIKLSGLKVDLAAEEKGEWVAAIDLPGVEFLVSSLQVPAFTTARDLVFQRWARKYGRKSVPPDERHEVMGKLFAQHILHGWRGLDEDYTPERASEILRDRSYRAVLAAVEACAAQVGEAQIEFIEDAGKNSAAPSATS